MKQNTPREHIWFNHKRFVVVFFLCDSIRRHLLNILLTCVDNFFFIINLFIRKKSFVCKFIYKHVIAILTVTVVVEMILFSKRSTMCFFFLLLEFLKFNLLKKIVVNSFQVLYRLGFDYKYCYLQLLDILFIHWFYVCC